MRSLSQAIARVETQLRFLPIATLRYMRILALLNEVTGSSFSYVRPQDELGRMLGGAMWPMSPWRLRMIPELGPVENTLTLVSDLYETFWDGRPGVAFVLPDAVYLQSPIYEFILRPLDQRHVAFYPYQERENGSQVMILVTRGHADDRPFRPRDLQVIEQVCHHFASELGTIAQGWVYQSRHAVPSEHSTELDPQLRPRTMSLYMQALLARFYGSSRRDADGRMQLPTTLEATIRRFHIERTDPVAWRQEGFAQALTKSYRGRLLCLLLESKAEGKYRLSIYEDVSRHETLRRIKAACRKLTRDRRAVFSACLLVAEGVRDTEEIARRAGFAALKPASALRIVNQARNLVAAASVSG